MTTHEKIEGQVKEFEKKSTYWDIASSVRPLIKDIFRSSLHTTTHHARLEVLQELEEKIETICEESEWECPEHGKEFKILPPLCKECNQCLEVNIIVVNLSKSIRSNIQAIITQMSKKYE